MAKSLDEMEAEVDRKSERVGQLINLVPDDARGEGNRLADEITADIRRIQSLLRDVNSLIEDLSEDGS